MVHCCIFATVRFKHLKCLPNIESDTHFSNQEFACLSTHAANALLKITPEHLLKSGVIAIIAISNNRAKNHYIP